MVTDSRLAILGMTSLLLVVGCGESEPSGPTPPPPPPPSGYVAAREYGNEAAIVWDAYVTPVGGVPHVVGGTMDGKFSMINLATGQVATFDGILNVDRLRGPGMTDTPGTWVMRDGENLTTWQLSGTPTKLAEHDELPVTDTRQAARLSDHVWMTTTNRSLSVWRRSGPEEAYDQVLLIDNVNEPEGVHLSPAGDRAAIRVDRVNAGVPVINAATGELAWRMSMVSVQGIDFTTDGASMLVVGHKIRMPSPEANDVSVLEVLRPSDGTVLASRTLPHVGFAGIFDPTGDRIYVAVTTGTRGSFRPALMLLRRSDLSTEAVFELPESAPGCGSIGDCLGGVIANNGDEVSIFHSWNGPPVQWRFKLPPN